MLSESPDHRPFAIRMRCDTDHTHRPPRSLRVAGTDAATVATLAHSSVPSRRVLNRPVPTIRQHDFCRAGYANLARDEVRNTAERVAVGIGEYVL